MYKSHDPHSIENQREMSFSTGRAVGLFEAAVCILDCPRVDLRTRLQIGHALLDRSIGEVEFSRIMAPIEYVGEPEAEGTKADMIDFRDTLRERIHRCILDYGDHFTGG